MAFNRSILGGSPLGLIGVKSYFNADGLSTFNSGKTRNTTVPAYNRNDSSTRSNAGGNLYGNSLFSGNRVVRAWKNVSKDDPKGLKDVDYGKAKTDNSTRQELHNNSIYDTSVLNIIEKLAETKASLKPADFAYLKNIGVFPNNRLMIARRFASPADDNIMVKKNSNEWGPFAVLISWVPENENFLSFTFGEEWTDSDADFTGILQGLGKDVGLDNLGGIAGAAGNALPLPGFTEIFQRNFLKKLGLIEDGAQNTIPAGNPNLIKISKRRKVIGYGDAGSGLKCTVNIKMVCEYELKYISGIDPTMVWMDLLGMITRFGTSNSATYGLSKEAGKQLISWANDPNLLIDAAAKAIGDAIGKIVEEIKEAIEKAFNKASEAASKLTGMIGGAPPDPTKEEPKLASDVKLNEAKSEKASQETILGDIKATLDAAVAKGLSGLLQKYRVKIIGIINSLTGLPSTPCHISIGNPMRPTFCSGDMLVEQVELRLGPTLAFNDLPSAITVEFNMTNARPWGLQEIMAKFNSGYLRTVDIQKSFYETNRIKGADGKPYNEAVGVLPINDVVYGSAGTSGSAGVVGSAGQSGTNANPAQGGTTGVVSTAPFSQVPFLVTPPANQTQFLGPVSANSITTPPNINPEKVTKAEDGKNSNKLEMNKDGNSPAYKNIDIQSLANTNTFPINNNN
jgi:hypothetical protein